MAEHIKVNVKNTIVTLKGLIILHSYLNRTDKRAMIVFNAKNRDENMIETILNTIQHNYHNHTTNLYLEYSELIRKKFILNMKYIQIFENNFSISKMDFVFKWK